MATQKQKYEAIRDAVSVIGDYTQVYKNMTQFEAITFIREIMILTEDSTQGIECIESIKSAVVDLEIKLDERLRNPAFMI